MSAIPDDDQPGAPQSEFFRKLQIEASCNENFDEILPDGTDLHNLHNPLQSIAIEVGYPDQFQPLLDDGRPNLKFLAAGVHHVIGEEESDRPVELAKWNRGNANDRIRFAFLKLQKPLSDWDVEEILIRKTLVYDPNDPRVDLSNGGTTLVTEMRTKDHAPVITSDDVGFVFVKFIFPKKIPDAISLTLRCKIGNRTDTLSITKANQRSVIWEIFSDKFFDETTFSYEIQCTAVGPSLSDEAIQWGTINPVSVNLPSGRNKFLDCMLVFPTPPAEQVERINAFIKDFTP